MGRWYRNVSHGISTSWGKKRSSCLALVPLDTSTSYPIYSSLQNMECSLSTSLHWAQCLPRHTYRRDRLMDCPDIGAFYWVYLVWKEYWNLERSNSVDGKKSKSFDNTVRLLQNTHRYPIASPRFMGSLVCVTSLINSLDTGNNFKGLFFKLILPNCYFEPYLWNWSYMSATEPHWW